MAKERCSTDTTTKKKKKEKNQPRAILSTIHITKYIEVTVGLVMHLALKVKQVALEIVWFHIFRSITESQQLLVLGRCSLL